MTSIDHVLDEAVSSYAGPIQIFDTGQIRANIEALGRALGGVERILFPVKSFPAREVLRLASDAGAGFEVSSPREYELLPGDLRGVTVSLNTPDPGHLDHYVERGNRLHVHLDSPGQVDELEIPGDTQLALRLSHTALGARDISTAPWKLSRFGATPETWIEGSPLFLSGRLSGVHVHNGSEVNTAAFYRATLALILSLAREHGLALEFINLGGGFHRIERVELEALLAALANEAGETPLYVEPGQSLCRDAGFLLAQVVAVRPLGANRFNITVDASHECHARWARLEWAMAEELGAERCEYDVVPSLGPGQVALHFTGSSCYERDVLGIYRLPRRDRLPIAVGDVVTFTNLHGYAYGWNMPFNGIPKADVQLV